MSTPAGTGTTVAADAITPASLAKWEATFGVLTESERGMITCPDGLIGRVESQRRHILRRYMDPLECPACQQPVPPRQALGHPIDFGKATADEFTCPHCHRGLSYTVPFIGSCYWRLAKPLPPATREELERE